MRTRDKYKIYLKPPEWKALRQKAIDYADGKCQLCNTPNKLNVHHRFYPKELGTEPVNDLTVLCDNCHIGFHRSFNLRNTNNKAKKKKTRKEIKAEKKQPKKIERQPIVRSKRQQRVFDEKIKRREESLQRDGANCH